MINEWHKYDLAQLKRGYGFHPQKNQFLCLVCGKTFLPGEIFPINGHYYDAEKAAEMHIQTAHGGMPAVLLESDKRDTGLTDNQKSILAMMLRGLTDNEIASQSGVSPATVRHTRFTFRERAKQAKCYLALYELTEQAARGKTPENELVEIHDGARMVDDRYQVTREEQEKILKDCFISLEPLKLKVFSAREKKKIVILRQISGLFSAGQTYCEKEINAILRPVYNDYATIRRYLIEYGFMERNADGSVYRLAIHHG